MAPDSTSTQNQLPSQADMVQKIYELEQQLAQMAQQQLVQGVTRRPVTGTYKMMKPEPYSGERGKLQSFLTQARLYTNFHRASLPEEKDKVLCIANLLKGKAFEWFEPYIRDYLENPEADWSTQTKQYFSQTNSYEIFADELKKIFGDVDEERVAERQMQQLRQTGSAANYTAEFRRIESKLDWDENALIAQYYRGLKESLKDELARQERPDQLHELIEAVVRLDNRLYERKLEKSNGTKFHGEHKKPKVNQQSWGDPMEIDTVNKGPTQHRKRGRFTPEQREWFKKGACLKCGRKGHRAKECKGKRANMVKKQDPDDPASKEATQHAALSWTYCYDDDCEVHRSEKDGSGWYPRAPKPKGQRSTKKQVASIVSNVSPGETITNFEIPIEVNGKRTVAMIDSGAHMNFINPKWVKEQGIQWETKGYPYKVTGVDGGAIGKGTVAQEVRAAELVIGNHREHTTLDLIPTEGHNVVLGLPWLIEHNPIIDWKAGKLIFAKIDCRNNHRKNCENPEPTEQRIRVASQHGEARPEITRQSPQDAIPVEYRDLYEVFQDVPDDQALPEHQSWDHEIPLQEGKQPHYLPLYQLGQNEQKTLREYIEMNLRRGFIRPSQSPAGYPILFVPKKDGSLRLCVDYRKLNDITIKNRYPLPLIDELREQTSQAKIFTKLDIKEAYHQVRIKEGEEWKTAFRTRYGHYEYTVMPFGLTNAPASFQSLINNVLRPYLDKFVVAYLDDILIYSKDEQEHVEHVRKVLEALRERKLRLKLPKCEFGVTRVEFLGYIIEPGQISMDPKKVDSIAEWPTPTKTREVQSFLGTANYYRRFIKGYSRIAAPLTELTKKDQPFRWGKEEDLAFLRIKRHIVTAPVLRMFDPARPITIETDASDYAIGACMSQPDDEGRLHPVMFYSRKMVPAEKNYDIHDKELLAIVDTFREWRVYLQGTTHQVKVITDHKNLTFFTTTKILNRRQTRWAETLGQYNFKIVYQKGSENARADALSRRADYQENGPTPGYQILRVEPDGYTYANPQVATLYKVVDEPDDGILKAYEKDETAKELERRATEEPWIHKTAEGYLRYYGKIYVPTSERNRILKQEHEAIAHGHRGVKKTYDQLKRWYYWPHMKRTIKERIGECVECAKNKPSRHRQYGQTQIPETPSRPWEIVTMDWIVKLPLSKEPGTGKEYDSIWVVMCKQTKYVHFVPFLETASAEHLAYWFLRVVVANYGMPAGIMSDRDRLITSKFWQSFTKQLGTKSKLSTAYHPETDGQTERTIQTLKQYLRFYLNYRQDNWVELLPMAQFAINSAENETTGMTPFYAMYGFQPDAYNHPIEDKAPSQSAKQRVELLKEIHKQLEQDIRFVAYKVASYRDKKNRLSAPTLREGDKVFLQRANLRTTRPSRKLDHVKVGPFKIKRKISEVNYELDLPKTMRIHPVFHVALLEPAPESAPLDRSTATEDKEYEVEKILDYQEIKGKPHYLVKWQDYTDAENTWEPKRNLMKNCSDLLREFHRQNPTVGRETSLRGDRPSTIPAGDQEELQRVQRILTTHPRLRTQAPDVPPLQLTTAPFETSPSHDALVSEAETLSEFGEQEPLPGPLSQREASEEPPLSCGQVSPLDQDQTQEELRTVQQWYPKTSSDESSTEEDEDDSWITQVFEEHRRDVKMHAQSLSDTTRLQSRPLDMHSEQRPEERSTRHSDPEDLQREQGVGMTSPRLETREANLLRRAVGDGALRGMVNKKRKRCHAEREGHLHHLYPRGSERNGCYGYRDEACWRGTKCYDPGETTDDDEDSGGRSLRDEG